MGALAGFAGFEDDEEGVEAGDQASNFVRIGAGVVECAAGGVTGAREIGVTA